MGKPMMMNLPKRILNSEEEAVYRLRALYSQYGYTRYKVSKFEQYDLYANNKSFLVCENILTFTDTNGKLMALKPDITLSIVKNSDMGSGHTNKLYYSETVYRTEGRAEGFREIPQTGLECIGRIDAYLTGEVVMLAKKSLALMSGLVGRRCLLDVSHMGFLLGLLETCGVAERDYDEVLSYIANKNLPAISAFMSAHGLPFASAEAIADVTSLYLPLPAALPRLLPYVKNETMQAAYDALSALSDALKAWSIDCPVSFDASIAGDRNYYNGIVFSGYLDGIPSKVLSGGRYDSLLSKMGKYAQAIGFAVYPERICSLPSEDDGYDVDACILYGKDTDPADLIRAVNALSETGVSVRTEEGISPSVSARAVYRMEGKEALPV
jgi:ATP phosphoribosyltransferase regulatory subunit